MQFLLWTGWALVTLGWAALLACAVLQMVPVPFRPAFATVLGVEIVLFPPGHALAGPAIGLLIAAAAGRWAFACHAGFRRAPADQVYLTFDDGPSPHWTPQILDILARHHVQATFFVLGEKAERYPDLIRRMLAEGHAVGGHGFRHRPMPWLSRRELVQDLDALRTALESCGAQSTLLRPPWGLHSRLYREEARARGWTLALWTRSTRDWTNPGATAVARRLARARTGDVLLLHDASHDERRSCAHTVEGLEQALAGWDERAGRLTAWTLS